MEDANLQQALNALQAQLNQQGAQLSAVVHQNAQLRARAADQDDPYGGRPVPDRLTDIVPPHLQLLPMPKEDRKKLIAPYPRYDLPASIRDDNGLAGRSIAGSDKKWIITHLPQLQRDNLDVARVACAAWHQAEAAPPSLRSDILERAMRDVLALAMDNAQRAAQTQLKQTFKAAGAEGAYALMALDPSKETHLDLQDNNLIQQAHADAMQDLKRFHKEFTPAKSDNKRATGGGAFNRGDRRGNSGRRFQGGGNNRSWNGGGRRNGDYNRSYNNRGGRNRGNDNNSGGNGGGSGNNGGSRPNDN